MAGGASDADDRNPAPSETPVDLVAVAVLVAFGNLAVLLPPLNDSALRVASALPLLLLLPGYAVVAAAVPRRSPSVAAGDGPADARGLDGPARLVVAVPCSIALVTVATLALVVAPVPVGAVTVSATVSTLTLGATGVAARRRRRLTADERFRVSVRSPVDAIHAGVGYVSDAPTATLLLLVCVVFAVGSVTFAVAAPHEGETFTEFYLLTENGSGELTVADSPVAFANGSSPSLVVGVENHEGRTVEYTVVVRLRRANASAAAESDRFSASVPDAETRRREHVLDLPSDGRYRVEYLLYRGDVPESPSVSTAYRRAVVWVTRGN